MYSENRLELATAGNVPSHLEEYRLQMWVRGDYCSYFRALSSPYLGRSSPFTLLSLTWYTDSRKSRIDGGTCKPAQGLLHTTCLGHIEGFGGEVGILLTFLPACSSFTHQVTQFLKLSLYVTNQHKAYMLQIIILKIKAHLRWLQMTMTP